MIPLDIRAKALFYPVVDYIKEYGEDAGNVSTGEIIKSPNQPDRYPENIWIGRRFVGSRDGYDFIDVYLGKGYFKNISKCKESGWTCQ